MKRLAIIAVLSLTSCGLFSGKPPDAADVYNSLVDICEAYQFAPPELRTENQDIACRQIKRVCVDASKPALEAPPPAFGNRVVDSGAAGSGDQ